MKQPSLAGRLRETSSLVALSAAAIVGCASPSSAANTITTGIFGGGSTLASQALRQLFDCYMGFNTAMTVPGGTTTFTDGFTFTTVSTLKPGFLPKSWHLHHAREPGRGPLCRRRQRLWTGCVHCQ
jgi:hypothetical protein